MAKTRKRKLAVEDISRCHPKRKGPTRNRRCLPKEVYQSFGSSSNPYAAAGCGEGENHCLLDKAPINEERKKELRKTYLRPRMPKAWEKDPDAWLDNYNIAHVMKQYEEAVPWFRFLGVFPIDFSMPDPYQRGGEQHCLYKETCNIQLKREYDKGVRGIGMIFNLDPHNKGGSHWVGLYINLHRIHRPEINYFDSYGYKTPDMIARLMRSFTLQIKSCFLGYNARRFQFGQSECGMFSMYFIVCMIAGISFKDFCSTSVDDDFMLQLRRIFFSK